MKRIRLAHARARKHWTLEQAAEHLQVDINTISRWEQGKTTPHPYNVDRLCTIYGATAVDLGLEDELAQADVSSSTEDLSEADEAMKTPHDPIAQLRSQDLTLRLLTIVLSWSRRNTRYDELQWLIIQETEDATPMTPTQEDPMSRRDALRRLAVLPIELYGLTTIGQIGKSPIEEILIQCAAGIVACEHLSKGLYEDMALADTVISRYLPTLQTIVKESSSSRQQAAALTAQALCLKSRLSVHAQGSRYAIHYIEQAALYSKQSNNLPLQLSILQHSAWIYFLNMQRTQALDKSLQLGQLLKKPSQPLTPLVQSYNYSGLAKFQAQAGRYDDALLALQDAHEVFSTSSDEDEGQIYVDFNHSAFIMDEGLTYYHMGQYEKASDAFAQAIDPETLITKIPASSERVRIEILNHQALASLKKQKKDRDLSIKLWKAGIQGAKALKSEQRFAESSTAYEIMESLWSGDQPIDDLRDFLNHW